MLTVLEIWLDQPRCGCSQAVRSSWQDLRESTHARRTSCSTVVGLERSPSVRWKMTEARNVICWYVEKFTDTAGPCCSVSVYNWGSSCLVHSYATTTGCVMIKDLVVVCVCGKPDWSFRRRASCEVSGTASSSWVWYDVGPTLMLYLDCVLLRIINTSAQCIVNALLSPSITPSWFVA